MCAWSTCLDCFHRKNKTYHGNIVSVCGVGEENARKKKYLLTKIFLVSNKWTGCSGKEHLKQKKNVQKSNNAKDETKRKNLQKICMVHLIVIAGSQ